MRPNRVIGAAVAAVVAIAACQGEPASPTPTQPTGPSAATAAVASAAATPVPTVAASPTGVPDVAAAFAAAYTGATSGTITVKGTATLGGESKSFTGLHQFNSTTLHEAVTVSSGGTSSTREQIRIGDERYTRTTPGPWLHVEPDATPSTGSGFSAALIAAAGSVSDAGHGMIYGRQAHRLVPANAVPLLPSMFGFAAPKDAVVSATVTFWALDDGKPFAAEILLAWAPPAGSKEVPGSVELTMDLTGLGTPPVIAKPAEAWVAYASSTHHYSMAIPERWMDDPGKTQDQFTIAFGTDDNLILLGDRLIVGRFALGGGTLGDAVKAVSAARRKEFGCKPTTEPIVVDGRDGVILTCDGSGQYSAREVVVTRGKYFYEIVWVYDGLLGGIFGGDMDAQRLDTFRVLVGTFRFES